MPRRYELVVFDWDGTLIDSAGAIAACIQAACRDLGLPVPDDERASHVIGLGLADALAYAVPSLPRAEYGRLVERYRVHFLARALEHTGLTPLFDATRCADQCAPKPAPEMLLALMAALDADPARTLMVGDTSHDLQMAAAAGVAAVAVSYGAHPGASLAALAPLALVDSTTELAAWLAANA
jgi:phosphoglycolate phosphatase